MKVTLTSYGACIRKIEVPDRNGNIENVVLGFENLDDYVERNPFFGVTVGRFAGRISNGLCSFNGEDYVLDQNDAPFIGPNCLHGGTETWSKKTWSLEQTQVSKNTGKF